MKLFIYSFALQVLVTAININCVAQDTVRTVYGKIISFEESFPLKNVSISGKDGKPLTGTDANGIFTLKLPVNEKLIVVRQEGYEMMEVPLTKVSEYNIVFKRR